MKNSRLEEVVHEIANQVEYCFDEDNGFDFAGAKAEIKAGFHRYFSGDTPIEESIIQKILGRNPKLVAASDSVKIKGDLNELQDELIDTILLIEKQLQNK